MKRIFISHPLTGAIKSNREKEAKICREIIKAGEGMPISPLNLFGFIDKEDGAIREIIMKTCEQLIEISDEVWIYGSSKGCDHEKEYAEKIGKKVVIKY